MELKDMGNKKKELGNGIIHTITNYIWWFILANLYFGIVNIPLIFVALGVSIQGTFEFNLLLLLALVPVGPALTALLSVMGKLVREKDINVTKDFFRAYKRNFFESVFYWSFLLVILSIIYIDISLLNKRGGLYFIKYILIAVGILIISMTFYILPIVSRFYFNIKDIFRFSLYYLVRKFHLTIFNWIYLLGYFIIYLKVPNIILLLSGWSIFAYLLMFNVRGVLDEIENIKALGKVG
jgi:uncharacterized membrane protein YesL